MYFEIISEITNIEVIAKGRATIRMEDGRIYDAEIHWYEADGIGRKRFKIKLTLD